MAALESDIEQEAMRYAVRRGWYEIKIEKASRNGFPDRFLASRGRVILIEFKRSAKEELSRLQAKERRALEAHGVEVHRVDTLEQAYELLR